MSRIIILTAGGHKPISALHSLDTAESAERASGQWWCRLLGPSVYTRRPKFEAYCLPFSPLSPPLFAHEPTHPTTQPSSPPSPLPPHFPPSAPFRVQPSLSLPSSVVAIGTIIGNGGESIIPLRSSSQSIRRDQSQARSRPTDIPSRPRRGPLESAAAMAGLLRPTTELGKKRSFVTINGREKDKRGQKIKVAARSLASPFVRCF